MNTTQTSSKSPTQRPRPLTARVSLGLLACSLVTAAACAPADDPPPSMNQGGVGGVPSGAGSVGAAPGATTGAPAASTGAPGTAPGATAAPTAPADPAAAAVPTASASATTTPPLDGVGTPPANLPVVVAPATPPEAYSNQCVTCHGAEGEGTALGPELKHPVVDYAAWVTRNGRPAGSYPGFVIPMVPFEAQYMSDMDLALTLAWLGAFPKPTTGAELFGDYCAHCHGADAKSGVVKLDLKLYLAQFPMFVRNGAQGGGFDSRTGYMPSWTAAELTDADIQMMSDYVSTL